MIHEKHKKKFLLCYLIHVLPYMVMLSMVCTLGMTLISLLLADQDVFILLWNNVMD